MFRVQHRAKLSCHCHNYRHCFFSYIVQGYKGCPKSRFAEITFRSERNNFICNEDGTGLHTHTHTHTHTYTHTHRHTHTHTHTHRSLTNSRDALFVLRSVSIFPPFDGMLRRHAAQTHNSQVAITLTSMHIGKVRWPPKHLVTFGLHK
jgi:hypothetical protein